jgi:hypothetical protein
VRELGEHITHVCRSEISVFGGEGSVRSHYGHLLGASLHQDARKITAELHTDRDCLPVREPAFECFRIAVLELEPELSRPDGSHNPPKIIR